VTFRSIQLWTTLAVLVLAPLIFGSVDLVWVVVWTILLSLSALCGIAVPMSAAHNRIMLGFLFLCGVYVLLAIIQIVPNAFAQLNDPAWARAKDLLGLDLSPRISSRAEIPPSAIGNFLLLATSVVNGFSVGTSQRGSDKLFRAAQYSILLYAIYGIAALVFTPNLVLWAPKLAYRGSLTATFINHNTAATYVGAGAILWACASFRALQSFPISSLRILLLTPSNERLAFSIIARLVGTLVCFFALLLTRSRGGLICCCLALLAAIMLMIANRQKMNFWQIVGSGLAALAVSFIWFSQTGRIGSEGLMDDGRWAVYGRCIDAIMQRPLLGAGAGTFADLFPSLRDGSLSTWGIWDYAHSTILEIAVEMGLPVAAMVVGGALVSIVILAKATLRAKDHKARQLAAITGIAVLGCLHSIIDFPLQIPGCLVVFGILLGCGLATALDAQQPINAKRPTRSSKTRSLLANQDGSEKSLKELKGSPQQATERGT
jgi:O-antigen ligase